VDLVEALVGGVVGGGAEAVEGAFELALELAVGGGVVGGLEEVGAVGGVAGGPAGDEALGEDDGGGWVVVVVGVALEEVFDAAVGVVEEAADEAVVEGVRAEAFGDVGVEGGADVEAGVLPELEFGLDDGGAEAEVVGGGALEGEAGDGFGLGEVGGALEVGFEVLEEL